MPSSAAIDRAQVIASPSRSWAPARIMSRVAEHRPRLGQGDQLGTERCGLAHEAVGGLQVAIGVVGSVELDGAGAHRGPLGWAEV